MRSNDLVHPKRSKNRRKDFEQKRKRRQVERERGFVSTLAQANECNAFREQMYTLITVCYNVLSWYEI